MWCLYSLSLSSLYVCGVCTLFISLFLSVCSGRVGVFVLPTHTCISFSLSLSPPSLSLSPSSLHLSSISLPHPLSPSLLSLSTQTQRLINIFDHAEKEVGTRSHTHTHSLSLKYTHARALALSLSHIHTYTHSLSITHTHSLIHTHTLSYTHTLSHTPTYPLSPRHQLCEISVIICLLRNCW